MRGLDTLKKHGVEFNTLTVINRKNSYHARQVYRFLKEIGSKYLQFIPIVEQVAATPDPNGLMLLKPYARQKTTVSEWSVEPLQFGKFLSTVFDEWVLSDVGRVFVQIFDVALESWSGLPQSLCVFAPQCGKAQARFGSAKATSLPSDCQKCDVRFACNGECPKHRFNTTASGEYGLNYLCAGYKHFFHHIDPYMRFMANELRQDGSPARVMEWARTSGSVHAPATTRRSSHASVLA
jgi:uncharacterized protein